LKDTYKHKGLREKLVKELILKGISDKNVLDAILNIPRHFFISPEFEHYAYQDAAFPISSGQTISQPYTVAYQTQLLEIKKDEKVLEIGTGSGYQAAILITIGALLTSIERIEKLHIGAKNILGQLNLKANLICGDGTLGEASYAPYDKIIVTAGAPMIPMHLVNQLKIGGKIIIPIGKTQALQKMVLAEKLDEGKVAHQVLGDFKFVPLIGKNGWQNG